MDRREVHWIVDNGIKMSAMPAFGPTHDQATIWIIAAFVKAMPAMTPAHYAALPSEHGGKRHAHGGEEGGADHVDPCGTPPHSH